ncbi:MAG: c-type cytochrome [Planctomycetales bacterium]|nr:c-type cytochrome [Planctomycetales bacterium]
MLHIQKALSLLPIVVAIASPVTLFAQHDHGSGGSKPAPPKIFLDKSPRIIEYQLQRLTNEQLLQVETARDDAKYLPVFYAILSRVGMPPAAREDALAGLVAINSSNPVTELVIALTAVKGNGQAAEQTTRGLAKLLLMQSTETLSASRTELQKLIGSNNPKLPRIGFAAIVAAGGPENAWPVDGSDQQKVQWLSGIELIPSTLIRNILHERVLGLVSDENPIAIRKAAVEALSVIPSNQAETFAQLAELVDIADLKDATIRTLLTIPPKQRDSKQSQQLIHWLVQYAESTPAAARTDTAFLDAMQLVDQLLAVAPSDIAKSYRQRLRETVVRVVRIHTVEEEMRYDIPYFAVEAGRPVQIVLVNEDLMPHNLVITAPGALQEVAELGMQAGPDAGLDGKQYVPKSEKVLFATHMVNNGATERLTFRAPQEPGEYPYVCTFPRHWMRMYGVMLVVEDLDQWNKNPVEPKDPIGSNRHFIKSWTMDDLADQLESGLRGRSPAIGQRLFVEATCAQCHKAGELAAGNVGPELNSVFEKLKGDKKAVLREILEPSHRIDDKYAVHLILTADGETVSGLVVNESKESVSILENPEAKAPVVIARDNIDEMIRTPNSMMPKGLLDRYSQDEIFEIVAWLESVQQHEPSAGN